jgi:hypothetical protein
VLFARCRYALRTDGDFPPELKAPEILQEAALASNCARVAVYVIANCAKNGTLAMRLSPSLFHLADVATLDWRRTVKRRATSVL